MKCEKSETGPLTLTCTSRLPINIFESHPAVELQARYQLLDPITKQDLALLLEASSKKAKENFKNKVLVCSQQKTKLKFSNDVFLHFCASKNEVVKNNFDTLIQGNTELNDKKTLYFEFLIKSFSAAEIKSTSNVFINAIKGQGTL